MNAAGRPYTVGYVASPHPHASFHVKTLDGLPDNRVQRLAFDPNTGDLWFETPSGGGRWISRLEIMSLIGQTPAILRKPKLTNNIPHITTFLSRVNAEYIATGRLQWATQKELYEAYVEWND